jgi:hypothetical protein
MKDQNKDILSGRLTAKKLITWCNNQFKKLEILNYEVTEIVTTKFNDYAYEGGACRLLFIVKRKDDDFLSCEFMGFYRISDYQEYIKKGYELYLKDTGKFGLIRDFTIEIRK